MSPSPAGVGEDVALGAAVLGVPGRRHRGHREAALPRAGPQHQRHLEGERGGTLRTV